MLNLGKTNLVDMDRDTLVRLTITELEEYAEARKVGTLGENYPRIINLETLGKHLGRYAFNDELCNVLKKDIKDIIELDVHSNRNKSLESKKDIQSTREVHKHSLRNELIYSNRYK